MTHLLIMTLTGINVKLAIELPSVHPAQVRQ